jgi:hypothetical protein
MEARRRISAFVLLVLLGAVCFLAACGGSGSSASSQSTQGVSIALTPPPSATSVAVGNTTGIQFNPVVSNDPSNSGVDWAVTCSQSTVSAAACGTLSISTFHSASGTSVNYIPPAFLYTGSLIVNVTVFATADHTKNVTTPITVTSYAAALNGTYVLQVRGSDSNPYPLESTGVFLLDGNGNITSGQQTLDTVGGFSATYTVQGSTTPSTYFVGPDGRGLITLNLQPTGMAAPIQETYTLMVVSSAEALVAEVEPSLSISASGTLELQSPSAATTMPTGAYAFVTNGSDSGSANGPGAGAPVPTALGGVFNIDNNPTVGSISGEGSLADQDYYSSTSGARTLLSCVPPAGVTGSVSQPTSLGIVTITLTGATCFGETPPASIQFTGYIVDATHIRLIESDDVNGTAGFLTAGIAVNQGSAAGTFTAASLSGPYVYGVLGYDINANVPSSFTSAGVIDASGATITGINDTFYPGDSTAYTANALTGTYSLDAQEIGRANIAPTFSGASPPPQVSLLAYLTGNGTPPLILWAEGEDPSFPAIGTGIAYPQAANASSLSFGNPENYGFRLTEAPTQTAGSGTIQSTINGVTGTLTGTLDNTNANEFPGAPGPPLSLLDTFVLPADNFGRIAGTFMNTGGAGPYFAYYLVDDNQGFFEETDLLTSGQVGIGYFAQACDVTSSTGCQVSATTSLARRASKPSNSWNRNQKKK